MDEGSLRWEGLFFCASCEELVVQDDESGELTNPVCLTLQEVE